MVAKREYFVWVDLETTGLNPEKDSILEIAIILTDFNLRTIATFHKYVSNAKPTSDYVRKMHKKSGLTEALSKVESFDESYDIDMQICQFLLDHTTFDGQLTPAMYYLAGSSVHFDAGFIELWFPTFFNTCSHRHLDVSSLLIAHRIKNPKFKSKTRKLEPQHRAQTDIQSSLDVARKYYGKRRRWKPRVDRAFVG